MARPRAGPLGFLEQLSGGLAAPTKQSLQGRVRGGIACPAAATGAAKPGNLFPGFQVSRFPTNLRQPGNLENIENLGT